MVIQKNIEYIESNSVAQTAQESPKYPFILVVIQFLFQSFGRIFPKIAGRLAYHFFTKPRVIAKHRKTDKIIERARVFEFMYSKQLLRAYEWGSGDETILLVHGWESRGTALRSFVPTLVDKGFRVVAFDGPAHGDSSGKRTNLPHFAGAIQAIINHIGSVHSIIAHSFGGPSTVYAMSVMNKSIEVENLVFVACPSRISWPINKAINTLKIPTGSAEEFKNNLREKLDGRPLEIADLSSRFEKTNVEKVLVVHDKKDSIVSFDSAQEIFDNWLNASLLVTEGFGHYRIMKNKEVVTKVVKFIAQ
jgi:pimeloyl-ACP methyl ester carboxylesterase